MVYTPSKTETLPIPAEPAVLSCYVPNTAAETNILLYVPWKQCKLSHAYTVVVAAIDATDAMEIDLELNAAGGTEMMTLTVAASSAVGTIDEATVSSQAACENLSSDTAARDAVNVEVDGSAAADGAVMLYLYFERWDGE